MTDAPVVLPGTEQLKKLPMRGIAAYAARCARRAQLSYRPQNGWEDWEKRRAIESFENAIGAAEAYSRTVVEPNTIKDAKRAGKQARQAVSAAEGEHARAVAAVAMAAANACHSSDLIIGYPAIAGCVIVGVGLVPLSFSVGSDAGVSLFYLGLLLVAFAIFAACRRRKMSKSISIVVRAVKDLVGSKPPTSDFDQGCADDYKQLLNYYYPKYQSFPATGEGIDLSKAGPLEPIAAGRPVPVIADSTAAADSQNSRLEPEQAQADLLLEREAMGNPTRDQVFISYSHADKEWLGRFQMHLKPYVRNATISVWDDTRIRTGSKWKDEIQKALASAKVAVLLVSPHFLFSDFIANHELPPLLLAAEDQGLTIIWVPISASSYDQSEVVEYQAVWNPSNPLDSLTPPEQNQALVEICKEIKAALNRS